MHQPIMLQAVVDGLRVRPGGCYVDATCGSGGHARAVAEALQGQGWLVVLDRDRNALERTIARLDGCGVDVVAIHSAFAEVEAVLQAEKINSVDGMLFDIGVSSEQLDTPERGFSFRFDAPLDMRMDRSAGISAAEWLQAVAEDELVRVLRRYGEEPRARAVAAGIVRAAAAGQMATTGDLVAVVEKVVGRRGRIHPATRTFQAIRMAVNDEIGQLRRGLAAGLKILNPGGRMAVITFHSGEDRIVKHFFREHEGRDEALAQGGSRWCGELPRGRRVNRRALVAGDAECAANPRARSAKLRIFEKAAKGD